MNASSFPHAPLSLFGLLSLSSADAFPSTFVLAPKLFANVVMSFVACPGVLIITC